MILIFIKLTKVIRAFQGIQKWGVYSVVYKIVGIEIERRIEVEKPNSAERVFLDINNIIAAQPVLFPVIGKFRSVIPCYAGIGCKPDKFFTILNNLVNPI